MATTKQKAIFNKLVDPQTGQFTGKSAKQALIETGYSESTALSQAKRTLESVGFRELLAEVGLTPNFLGKALFDDIKNKPGRRVREIELAAKMTGMLKDQNNVQVNITLEDILAPISDRQEDLTAPDRQIGQVIEMPRINAKQVKKS